MTQDTGDGDGAGDGDGDGDGDSDGDGDGDSDDDGSAGVPTCRTDVSGQLAVLGVPGLSAGIVRNGRLHCTAVAGLADIESGRPVTPDTIFTWASATKTVTATTAMVLLDDGAFGLDDDIDEYLPFSVRNPNCPSQPITFRQLLTHTSSIIDNEDVYDASYTVGDSPIALGDFVQGYFAPGGDSYDPDANFAEQCPGEVNDYSNIAIGLLGHVLETIARTPFDELCRDRVLTPLGMDETAFFLADLDPQHLAMPYEGDAESGFEAYGHFGFPTYPDGLFRSSVPHMARLLAMMAEGGVYDGERILLETTVDEIERVQFPDLDDTQGLVWYYDFDGARLGHDGEDPGTSSIMFFDPADGTGVLLVANGDWYADDDDAPNAYALVDALFQEAKGG